ncbi:MAG: TetR/AcrR family transcriptional regulator, transcriptional repressor for nem operon [Acetobacteraceae bacterium]|jgi:TetR/AcrR family transcriptional repressor of nem operon|nr:TetR family transcriptional regulator [Rhodopila sp.]MEA2732164.1 TetR/AcrR family transcriptional regulator, transcriptional repressor for nem operon [Acetobacteraceae bacterium]
MARLSSHDVRERLLEAGVRTFSKAGFNGCSVQDITDAAGVPKGSFYNHFESKEALGAAALQHYWTDGACDQLKILTRLDMSPRERLRTYFEEATAEMAQIGFTCGCLVGNMAAELSDHSPIIAIQLSAIFLGWSGQVAECIRAAQAAGEIESNADPDQLAAFVLNAWEGAVLRARIEKADRPLRQFIQTLFTILLR